MLLVARSGMAFRHVRQGIKNAHVRLLTECEWRFLSRCLALVYDGCRRESGLQVALSVGQKSSSPLLLQDVAEGPSERTGGNRAIRNQFTPASGLYRCL
jgi:hypothetical protein